MTLNEAKTILNLQQAWRLGKVNEVNYSPRDLTNAIDVVLDEVNKIPDQPGEMWNFLYINAIRGGIGNEGKAELAFRLYSDPEVKALVDEKVREDDPTFAHELYDNINRER